MTTWTVPILALRAAGSCAVMNCASTESDKVTSQAACSLQNIKINWYRRAIRRKTSAGSTDPEIQKTPEIGSKSKLDKNDLSPLPFFRSQMSQFIARSSSSEDSLDPDTETYIKLDAVMSVCDTESGPAIELRTVSKAYAEMLVKYELTDVSKNMDMITNLPVNDQTSESFPILERIIPLSMVENAALGGKWDWANVLSENGDLHCGVKVFGSANDFQLIGHGQQILQFDLQKGSVLDRTEAVAHINALIEWNQKRTKFYQSSYASQVGMKQIGDHDEFQDSGCASCLFLLSSPGY